MNISVDNSSIFEKAKEYFQDSSDSIEVKQTDKPLSKIDGNIYGLYVDGTLKYIGERQSGKIASRLNQHLHSCPSGTSSKLDEVNEAYADKKKVTYKTLLITPDYERYSLETFLIQNIDKLEWNVRDKGKKFIEISPTDDIEVETTEE